MSNSPIRPIPTGGKTTPEKVALRSFSTRLRELRTERGLSQSDLARAIWGEIEDERGYMVANRRGRISAYEAGRATPEPHNLAKLAEALGVPQEELAPDITASAIQHTDPEFAIHGVPGNLNLVHLQINTLIDLNAALEIGKMITASKSSKYST